MTLRTSPGESLKQEKITQTYNLQLYYFLLMLLSNTNILHPSNYHSTHPSARMRLKKPTDTLNMFPFSSSKQNPKLYITAYSQQRNILKNTVSSWEVWHADHKCQSPCCFTLKLKYFKLIPQDAKQIATKAILKALPVELWTWIWTSRKFKILSKLLKWC